MSGASLDTRYLRRYYFKDRVLMAGTPDRRVLAWIEELEAEGRL